MFNVTPERWDWVNRRCVPQALATFEMPILLSGQVDAIERRIFILADDWDPSPFRFFAKKYESVAGWQIMKMRCGHSVMVDMPRELAALLHELAWATSAIWPDGGHLDRDFEELRRGGGMRVSEEVLFGARPEEAPEHCFPLR